MLEITNKDWFINQKSIPDITSDEYEDFFEYHKKLCIDGCKIDGIYIPGKLYWHLNFWHADIDFRDERGRPQQSYSNPLLRDNEWLFFTSIEKAEAEMKGLAIGGSRRIAKSVLIASYISHGATFDEGSQNVIAALNSTDIKVTWDKIDKGLNYLPKYFKWHRIEDDPKKQVTLGIKNKSTNERMVFSSILMRNLAEGNNQEIIAGTKPRKLVIEEGGKGPFLSGLQAAIPGFTTPFGWTCSPLVIFTGGDMTSFRDAKELFFAPDAYNFVSLPNEKDPRRFHGLFLGAKYRLEGKEPSTLGDYLKIEEKCSLHDIPMMVASEEKAFKITDDELLKRKKSGDRTAFLKEKMYFPKEVDDIFLNESTNIFDIDSLKHQQQRIKNSETEGMYIELYHDGEKIRHKSSEKLPISNYPIKPTENKDAPIVMWEPPMQNVPFGLYVAGVDPYRQGQSKYSDSLGSVYIYKRMHDVLGEKFQDMFVASYVARPNKKEDWQEQARMLIKYYNARALVENDEYSFIDYMVGKGDAMYLEKTPQWIREYTPNSSSLTREFGISRAADRIRDVLHGNMKMYLEEILSIEKDDEGSIVKEVLGVNRLRDLMLLEELIQYNEDDNFDRIVAAEIAITMARKLDPVLGKINGNKDSRVEELYNRGKKKGGLFTESQQVFYKNKRTDKLFL
jgi:hypothetical protein